MADRSFLDWPFLGDDHRRLARDLDDWCAANLTDHHSDDVDSDCRALVRALGDAGWLRYCVPAAYGGVHDSLDIRSLALIRETLARHSGLADFAFAMQGLGSGTISLLGTATQKQAYLPDVAAGRKIAAFALTEPASGSDVASMETTADRTAEGYVVNGAKTYISNGGIADYYILFARTGEAPGAKGVSCFIVDADTPGFAVTDRIAVIAPHPLATLTFTDMVLPRPRCSGNQAAALPPRWRRSTSSAPPSVLPRLALRAARSTRRPRARGSASSAPARSLTMRLPSRSSPK
jgi:acyl-CoA dehydrogenase